MTELNQDAVSSVGPIVLLPKEAVLELWRQIGYRANWSLDDVPVRARAAVALRPMLPRTGRLVRALASGNPWVTADVSRASGGRGDPGQYRPHRAVAVLAP